MSRRPRVRGWCGGWSPAMTVISTTVVALLFFGGFADLSGQTDPSSLRPQDSSQLAAADLASGTEYEVRVGDTLWEIAARFLGDPERWREIMSANDEMPSDPGRLQPGTRLLIPGGAAAAPASEPERAVDAEPEPVAAEPAPEPEQPARVVALVSRAPDQDAGRGVSKFAGLSVFDIAPVAGDVLGGLDVEVYEPPELVSPSLFYGTAYVIDPDAMGPTGVAARKIEENPNRISMPPAIRLNGRVVLWIDGMNVSEGDLLQAFRWGRRIGRQRVVHTMGLLRVTDIEGDSARAIVTDVFSNFEEGDLVVTPPPFTPVGTSRSPVERGLVTEVAGFEIRHDLLGLTDVVFLDAGSDQGIGLGDEFAVFSRREQRPATARLDDLLIVVRVVRVTATHASARVVDVLDPGATVRAPARLIRRPADGG